MAVILQTIVDRASRKTVNNSLQILFPSSRGVPEGWGVFRGMKFAKIRRYTRGRRWRLHPVM